MAVIATLVMGVWLWTRAQAAPVARPAAFTNPVFARDFPDPMVLRNGAHDYFAYGTGVDWIHGAFPILHSTDLVHWKSVGTMFKTSPAWGQGDFWAPDVVKRGGLYYAYYTGKRFALHCIGLAVARSPTGPFTGAKKFSCGDLKGLGYIDPDVLVDVDGKAYLYVSVDSPDHTISVIPLKPDLQHAAGPRKELFGLTQKWEHGAKFSTVEGPFVIRRGSTYYLFFSGNDWNGDYAMGYATATSPMGPFTPYSGNPILRGDSKVHGPGGGSVVTGPDGGLWMVYHAWPGVEGYANGGIRNMRIGRITWKGSVPSVQVTP